MRVITYRDKAKGNQLCQAIRVLSDFLHEESNRLYLDSIEVHPDPLTIRRGFSDDRGRDEFEELERLAQVCRDAQEADEKVQAEMEPYERPIQLAFVVSVVEEVQRKDPDFSSPAFKSLEDFKTCVSSRNYSSFLCLTAFIITMASIVMPFANPHGKEK